MIILFREMITLLPLLILCMAVLFVLFFILLRYRHNVIFFITIFGIVLSLISLYFVWKNGVQKFTDLICIDGFSIICMLLILLASLMSGLMARMYSLYYSFLCRSYNEFYLLLLIATIGAIMLITASHVVTLFFGIELISLPLFGLMSYFHLRKYSLEATVKYVLLSGVSTAFLLFGIGLLYSETMYLSFIDIHLELIRKSNLNQSMVLMVSISMILVGFGFKLSLVPFHLWTADVYQGTPEIVGICLAVISKISIFSALTRFFLLFPQSYNKVYYILSLMSCCSILFGNLMAIQQNNVKRILAYSSIAHMGYLLIGVIGSGMEEVCEDSRCILNLLTSGITTISIGLVNYFFATLGAFSILGLVFCFYSNHKNDVGTISLYRGLFWKDPILSILFTIVLLALAGIPITLGFIGKFYLILLSIRQELWLCTVIIIFSIVIGMLYYLRIVTILYLSPSLKRIKYLSSFLCKANNIKVVISSITSHCYNNCNNRWIFSVFGFFLVFFSSLLLFFGVYPRYLLCFFSLIQKNF